MESADGRFVFVMARSCRSRDQDVRPESVDGFTQSGLYRNDGSTEPLWTVDWCGSVMLPSDGIHLIRQGPWASWRGDEALSLFANGRLLYTYRVGDLVDWPSLLPATVSHFEWRQRLEAEGGDGVYPLAWRPTEDVDRPRPLSGRRHAENIRLRTLHGDSYVIALDTGEIVSSSRPLRVTLLGLLVLGCVGYAVALARISSRAQPSLRRRLLDMAWWTTVGTWAFVSSSIALSASFSPWSAVSFRKELFLVFGGGLALATILGLSIAQWHGRKDTEEERRADRRVVWRAGAIAWSLVPFGILPPLIPRAFPWWSGELAHAAFLGVIRRPLLWVEHHGLPMGRGAGVGADEILAVYAFWLPVCFIIALAHSALTMILARARGQRSTKPSIGGSSLARASLWLAAQLAACAASLWLVGGLVRGLSVDGPSAVILVGATAAAIYLVARSTRRELNAVDSSLITEIVAPGPSSVGRP